MAEIQFSQGITEPVIPDVRLTKSKTGEQSTATFYFDQPAIFNGDASGDITGMYMIDDEGELVTREVKAKFINGKAAALEAIYIMNTTAEWDRFMRFMELYSETNGLGFSKTAE